MWRGGGVIRNSTFPLSRSFANRTVYAVYIIEKIFCYSAIIILIFALLAGTAKDTPVKDPENTDAVYILTNENIQKFISIEASYSNIISKSKLGIPFGLSDIKISVSPLHCGIFHSVEIKLRIILTDGWTAAYSDHPSSDNKNFFETTLKLSSDGRSEQVYPLVAAISYGEHNNEPININILSVKGSFLPQS